MQMFRAEDLHRVDRRIYDKYILEIARQGSLTRAAAALGISQPALSSGLNHLEKEIGIRVFNRRTVPISFTPEGEVYFDYIKRLSVLDQDLRTRIAQLREETEDRVAVGGTAVYIGSVITDAIIRLRQEFPQYRIEVRSGSLPELIEMANKGEINCFVSTSDHLPDKYRLFPIRKEIIRLCIPKDDPVNRKLEQHRITETSPGSGFDYSVLSGKQFIFLEENQPLQKQLRSFLSECRIRPENRIVVDQVSAAVHLSARGEGICFASEASLSASDDVRKLAVYPLPESVAGRQIYAACDKERVLTKACKALMAQLGADLSEI